MSILKVRNVDFQKKNIACALHFQALRLECFNSYKLVVAISNIKDQYQSPKFWEEKIIR